MFSGQEWIIILIIAVVLFGGSQIPKLARSIGQAQKEFKSGLSEGAADDPPGPTTSGADTTGSGGTDDTSTT